MQCPNCQHDNETGAHFCEECGFDLTTVPPPPPAAPTLPPQPTAPSPTGTISPYTGPRLVLNATGSIFKLGDLTVIGREDPTLQIDLDGYQDGNYISHRHAQITRVNDTFFIEDLNSANHTRVNGIKLAEGQSEPLHEGDIVRFGKIELTFHES